MILFAKYDGGKMFFKDKNLSMKSRFIMQSLLLNNQYSPDAKLIDIATSMGISRRLLRKGLLELEANKYLTKIEVRMKNGDKIIKGSKIYLFSASKDKITSSSFFHHVPKDLEDVKFRFYPWKKILRITSSHGRAHNARSHTPERALNNLLFSFLSFDKNILRIFISHSFKEEKTRFRGDLLSPKPPKKNQSKTKSLKTAKAKIVWDCWNEFASNKNSPIPKHRDGTKREAKIFKAIKKALVRWSEVSICESIEKFYSFLTKKCPPSYRKLPGIYKIPLDEFISFTSATLDRIAINKTAKKIIDFESWMQLCFKDIRLIEDKFMTERKMPKNFDQKIIRQFEKSWIIFSEKPSTKRDQNNFAIASEKLLEFIHGNKRHLAYDPADGYWIYKFIRGQVFGFLNNLRDNTSKKIHSGFLTQDFFYEDQLKSHLKFIGVWHR